MRRSVATLLLLVLTLPLVAPAMGQTAQQRVLHCCRKGGTHHCMSEETRSDGVPVLRSHCYACSNQAVAGHADTWIAREGMQSATYDAIVPLRIRQVEAGYRKSFYRSRQKRGPPALVLS